MKLNYKRTVCVGFAFFLICAFWQAYDNIIPKILTDKFGMSQTWSGLIMAIDNVFALFMLPLFGTLSDKCRSKHGRRTPYIFIGTIAAAVAFLALSFADNMQLTNLGDAALIDDESALSMLYNHEYDNELTTPEGEKFDVKALFTEEEFVKIKTDSVYELTEDGKYAEMTEKTGADTVNPYVQYVTPMRQAYAWETTAESPVTLVYFMLLLLITLVSMATFRSPAVALMPDVTVKPLRSKANAVINLMGSFGGILILVLGMVLGTGSAENALMPYTTFFAIVSGVMLIALGAFVITVNEPKFVAEMHEESKRLGIEDDSDEETGGDEKLSKSEFRSLLLILASVVLWYFGYNAVTSKYSVYASEILHLDYNLTLIIAQAAAIISYIPVGIISSKAGRKKTILAGVAMLATAFFIASFMREGSSALLMNCMFALAGIGWATINVNSFPMVVELSKNSNVGKYTGFYYTASMAAQTITPVFSGIFLDIRMTTLFPYATVFVVLSFVTMLFVRHGDSKPEANKSLDAFAELD